MFACTKFPFLQELECIFTNLKPKKKKVLNSETFWDNVSIVPWRNIYQSPHMAQLFAEILISACLNHTALTFTATPMATVTATPGNTAATSAGMAQRCPN